MRLAGLRVGLVPTMGALHDGHLSLVRASQAQCDMTVVTIFVNPTQFGPNEDFDRYPRTLDTDLALLNDEKLLVYAPATDAMYPPGYNSFVEVAGVSEPLEGAVRPGHFRGVATVVLKLFLASGADVAFFGQKDLQQVAVIQRMVTDLDVPIEIVVCPIIREPDGLAMSSRNRYLAADQRRQAVVLSQSLKQAEMLIAGGETDPNVVKTEIQRIIETAAEAVIDYIAIVDPATFQEPETQTLKSLNRIAILLAVRFGATRLIDNFVIERQKEP